MGDLRVQVRKDGSIHLPKEVAAALEAGPGSYVKITESAGRVILEKTAYDPWVEGQKKAADRSFDDMIKRQKEGLAEAEKDFIEKLKAPPEVRPEDRPDFWD